MTCSVIRQDAVQVSMLQSLKHFDHTPIPSSLKKALDLYQSLWPPE